MLFVSSITYLKSKRIMRTFSINSVSFSRVLKKCAIVIGVFLLLELVIFNIMILYAFWSFKSAIYDIVNSKGATILDKLAVNPVFQDLVTAGKEGGFADLIHNTFERVYIESYEKCAKRSSTSSKSKQLGESCVKVSSVGLDVSESGEALYIYRRIQERTSKPWEELIVDIGANDGLLSSNSYNFIKWGWSAILVEPQSYQVKLAERNLKRYIVERDGDDSGRFIKFFPGVIHDQDGHVEFKLSSDIVNMQSHVVEEGDINASSDKVMYVKSYSVRTFAELYNVPKYFGILSIDAEGVGSKILHQWIELSFRPAYIIYEDLHETEPVATTIDFLKDHGYKYLTMLGWNHIFEYQFSQPSPS